MARRRRPAVVAPDVPTVPAELRECVAAQWLTAREMSGEIPHGIDPTIVAWRRWRDARRAWLAETGATALDVPTVRPRWRESYPIETIDSASRGTRRAKREVFPR